MTNTANWHLMDTAPLDRIVLGFDILYGVVAMEWVMEWIGGWVAYPANYYSVELRPTHWAERPSEPSV